MGLIDKIKNFIYSDNSEYDEQMDEGYAEEESDAGSSSSSSSASDFSSFSNGSNYSSYSSSRGRGYTPRTGRVVNIQTSAQLQVILVHPDRF